MALCKMPDGANANKHAMNIHQIASKLQEVALLENTELGDYWCFVKP